MEEPAVCEDDEGKWCASATFEPRVESLNERHRREITEEEARFGTEREPERQGRAEIANAAADQRIAGLEAEVLELARATNAVIEALEVELSRATSENRELKLAQARLETRLAELQLKISEATVPERSSKIIDLPPLPRVN
ncbi:hypothetical protein [Bradyrhizobium sp. UFLA05-112]